MPEFQFFTEIFRNRFSILPNAMLGLNKRPSGARKSSFVSKTSISINVIRTDIENGMMRMQAV
jgi:hypothetical protein